MNALRQYIRSTGTQVILNLPHEFQDQELEIIVLPIGHTKPKKQGVTLGSWEGKYHIPDDFNDPLDDLKEYM